MKNEPIDYRNPLGISKKEWIKVLGANLALLLTVYVIALVCTLRGSDFFLLNFQSEGLQRIEDAITENKIEALQGKIQSLELANQLAGVVRYPNGYTYNAGPSPFCQCGGCGCGCGNI